MTALASVDRNLSRREEPMEEKVSVIIPICKAVKADEYVWFID